MEYEYIDALYHELNKNLKIMREKELGEIYITFKDNIFKAVLEEPDGEEYFYTVDKDPYSIESEIFIKEFRALVKDIVMKFEEV